MVTNVSITAIPSALITPLNIRYFARVPSFGLPIMSLYMHNPDMGLKFYIYIFVYFLYILELYRF